MSDNNMDYGELSRLLRGRHGVQSMRSIAANAIDQLRARVVELEAENLRLKHDELRLDWLADRDNSIGNVQLPTDCVTANLGSLRYAIDAAMGRYGRGV